MTRKEEIQLKLARYEAAKKRLPQTCVEGKEAWEKEFRLLEKDKLSQLGRRLDITIFPGKGNPEIRLVSEKEIDGFIFVPWIETTEMGNRIYTGEWILIFQQSREITLLKREISRLKAEEQLAEEQIAEEFEE